MFKSINASGRAIQISITALSLAIVSSSQMAAAQGASANPAPEESVSAPGDVNLYPRRVVLDGRRAVGSITLFNRELGIGNYEVAITDLGMTPDGQLLEVDRLNDTTRARLKPATSLLRYSPRRTALKGGEAQSIRIMARAGSDIPPGEYRSHFSVVAIPDDVGQGYSIDQATGGSGSSGIGVVIRPRFGISIPIILRIGETTLNVGISDARLLTENDGSQSLSFIINRSGTRSAYGDITATVRGSDTPIALLKGIGVYPEIDSRRMTIPINVDATNGTLLGRGSNITIKFTDDDYEPGATLAEHTFVLP